MKKMARITSKGQITVPHEVRRALGVGTGDRLLFEKDGAEFRLRPVRSGSVFEKFRGAGGDKVPAGRKAIAREIRKMRGR
jgi:antitoxin PrlF